MRCPVIPPLRLQEELSQLESGFQLKLREPAKASSLTDQEPAEIISCTDAVHRQQAAYKQLPVPVHEQQLSWLAIDFASKMHVLHHQFFSDRPEVNLLDTAIIIYS
jgi:hypothetical protein